MYDAATKPFRDGTHKRNGFQAAEKAVAEGAAEGVRDPRATLARNARRSLE
jgi:CDGSH-type Zn-finger protein